MGGLLIVVYGNIRWIICGAVFFSQTKLWVRDSSNEYEINSEDTQQAVTHTGIQLFWHELFKLSTSTSEIVYIVALFVSQTEISLPNW